MKRISGRIFALFAFVFVVTLIATAPATLLAKIMEGSSNGQLLLVNATGTVWQGSASPAIRQRSGKLIVLEKLHWDVAFLPLFTGKMRIDFQWENVAQALPMVVTISLNQIELRNAVIPLHASVLGELTPLLQPVQLRGQMLIKSDQFTFSRQGLTGNAVADWLAAGSVLSNVDPLGNYRINLVGAGERLDLVLMTLSGALLLEGRGSFAAKQGLSFQVSARAAAESKGSLDELLSNFGPQTAPGVHTLSLMR
jgi:general secretion pathway protein N